MYGWLGNYDLQIEDNGELPTGGHPPPINYVTSMMLQDNLEYVINSLTFNATFVIPTEPTKCIEPDNEPDNYIIIILEVALGVLSLIILMLITILVCVHWRNRKSKPAGPKG